MNTAKAFILGLIVLICFSSLTLDNDSINTKKIGNKDSSKYESFELYYNYAGLGSGMGSLGPVFIVKGTKFKYYFSQNSSFDGKYTKKDEAVCDGKIRISSIDSILDLVKDIKDTLIYKTNTGISSGGIHNISIQYENIKIQFQLHNEFDSTAFKITEILNSNIPEKEDKLWLFNYRDSSNFSDVILDTAFMNSTLKYNKKEK